MENVSSKTCFRLNELVVEPNLNLIRAGKKRRRITAREMEVLLMLVQRQGELVSRDALLEHVWNGTVVNEEALTLTISRLRKALADDPRKPRMIETIPKKGYRLMVTPLACQTVVQTRNRTVLGRPALWIILLASLVVIFASLFFRVQTEYLKVSDVMAPPDTVVAPSTQ